MLFAYHGSLEIAQTAFVELDFAMISHKRAEIELKETDLRSEMDEELSAIDKFSLK